MDLGGFLGIAVIDDGESTRMAKMDSTFCIRGDWLIVVVENNGFKWRQRLTDGTRILEPFFGIDPAGDTDIGGPLGLGKDRPPPLDHSPFYSDRTFRTGVTDPLQAGEVILAPGVSG